MRIEKLSVLLVAFAGIYSPACVGHGAINKYVEYSGDLLPNDSTTTFDLTSSATGTASVAGGILTIDNTGPRGSLDYMRTDQLLVDDLAVFQFRTRLDSFTPTASVRPGSVVQVRWVGETPGQFLFFADSGFMRLAAGGPFTTETSIPLDTTVFHTYSIVKRGQQSVDLYLDGNLALSTPFSNFRITDIGPTTTGAFEEFQGNPNSKTEWDFFRYAIGNDALLLIPVPEPSTALLAITGFATIFTRRRKSVPQDCV